jgi:hypothetical protein
MDGMKPNNIITNFLTIEHGVFCELFSVIETLLPEMQTAAEVRLVSRLVAGMLQRHADVEQNLAYAALDHVLAEKGQLNQLYQDHQEIDACLQHATTAEEFVPAVRFLRAGLKASREHFRREEDAIFPLFERLFDPAVLGALGGAVSGGAGPWPHGFESALRGRLWNPEYFYQLIPQAPTGRRHNVQRTGRRRRETEPDK